MVWNKKKSNFKKFRQFEFMEISMLCWFHCGRSLQLPWFLCRLLITYLQIDWMSRLHFSWKQFCLYHVRVHQRIREAVSSVVFAIRDSWWEICLNGVMKSEGDFNLCRPSRAFSGVLFNCIQELFFIWYFCEKLSTDIGSAAKPLVICIGFFL